MSRNSYVILTLALFFGWQLSFPFFGPLFQLITPLPGVSALFFTYILAQALAFFAGGFFFRRRLPWKKMMIFSLFTVIATNLLLLFSPAWVWSPGIALLGIAAGIYALGWSCPFTAWVGENRIKVMAFTIIGSNIIYLLLNLLSRILAPALLRAVLLCPLLITLLILLRSRRPADSALQPPAPERPSVPVPVILIVSLFIVGLYLNGGLMYYVIYPSLDPAGLISTFFRFIPYKLILLFMWFFSRRLHWSFSVYLGVSLLGLAFVSFAVVGHELSRFFLTETLYQAAFALLDLFCWVLLGEIAAIYRFPTRIFGFGLGSMLAGITVGEVIGEKYLLSLDHSYRLVTALFAACAIFLTFLVIPWLDRRVIKGLRLELPRDRDDIFNRIRAKMSRGKGLTPREEEIVQLLLSGISNKQISQALFISENTLKTHLKHIYQKFEVSGKRELIAMVLQVTGERKTR